MGQDVGIEMKAIFLRTHRNAMERDGKIPPFMQKPLVVILTVIHCVFQYSYCLIFPLAKPLNVVFHKQLRNVVIHKYSWNHQSFF